MIRKSGGCSPKRSCSSKKLERHRSDCGLSPRRFLGILVPPPPTAAGAQPAQARGNGAHVLDQPGKALSAAERAVERGHGPRLAGIVVVDPSAQNGGEQ